MQIEPWHWLRQGITLSLFGENHTSSVQNYRSYLLLNRLMGKSCKLTGELRPWELKYRFAFTATCSNLPIWKVHLFLKTFIISRKKLLHLENMCFRSSERFQRDDYTGMTLTGNQSKCIRSKWCVSCHVIDRIRAYWPRRINSKLHKIFFYEWK